MNALDILDYGHRDTLAVFDGLSGDDWNRPGVTSSWSPKDVLAHLTSFELVLEDVMKSALGRGPTPMLESFTRQHASFNEDQVAARRGRSPAAILEEYGAAHARVMALARELGPDRLREIGTIPWYGETYALDDFVVYANYSHKREHCAQLKLFRRRPQA
jgi:hypothetical protein